MPSGKYGENPGDPMRFSSHQSSELQIGDHAFGPARASQRLSIPLLNRAVSALHYRRVHREAAEPPTTPWLRVK